EARAVATMRQYSVGFSMRLGEKGYRAAKGMMTDGASNTRADEDSGDDARFEDDGPNDADANRDGKSKV
ncbi:MAG: hypothetical protein QGF20_19465, partial [Alphaproteobacteria bacterium]|nr:hypothetical protein [Alphaproteobacteria bacterium]